MYVMLTQKLSKGFKSWKEMVHKNKSKLEGFKGKIIFAGSQGFLDNIELERIQEFEEKLYDFLDASHSTVLTNIRESGGLSDEDSNQLKNALSDFAKGF